MATPTIFDKRFENPKDLQTQRFVLFPTDDSYFESDFHAVMKSKTSLRIWSQSTWPEDDFTAAQNKEDLGHHIEDNKSHSAYGYMIYSLDRKTCYGSLYVNPLLPILDNYIVNEPQTKLIQSYDARIDFWTLEDDPGLEEIVAIELCSWLEKVWKLKVLFSARNGMDWRMKIYQSMGLQCRVNLMGLDSKTSLLLWGQ